MFVLRNINTYMCPVFFQPERIDPPDPMNPDYDVRADVWSLGITLVNNTSFSFPVALYFSSTKILLLHAMLTLQW